MSDPVLSTKEAARILALSHRTLEGLRLRRKGPRFLTLPNGRVRYFQSDVIAWRSGAERVEVGQDGVSTQTYSCVRKFEI